MGNEQSSVAEGEADVFLHETTRTVELHRKSNPPLVESDHVRIRSLQTSPSCTSNVSIGAISSRNGSHKRCSSPPVSPSPLKRRQIEQERVMDSYRSTNEADTYRPSRARDSRPSNRVNSYRPSGERELYRSSSILDSYRPSREIGSHKLAREHKLLQETDQRQVLDRRTPAESIDKSNQDQSCRQIKVDSDGNIGDVSNTENPRLSLKQDPVPGDQSTPNGVQGVVDQDAHTPHLSSHGSNSSNNGRGVADADSAGANQGSSSVTTIVPTGPSAKSIALYQQKQQSEKLRKEREKKGNQLPPVPREIKRQPLVFIDPGCIPALRSTAKHIQKLLAPNRVETYVDQTGYYVVCDNRNTVDACASVLHNTVLFNTYRIRTTTFPEGYAECLEIPGLDASKRATGSIRLNAEDPQVGDCQREDGVLRDTAITTSSRMLSSSPVANRPSLLEITRREVVERWGADIFNYYNWSSSGKHFQGLLKKCAKRTDDWPDFRIKVNQVMLNRHIRPHSRSQPSPTSRANFPTIRDLEKVAKWRGKWNFIWKDGPQEIECEYRPLEQGSLPEGFSFDKYGLLETPTSIGWIKRNDLSNPTLTLEGQGPRRVSVSDPINPEWNQEYTKLTTDHSDSRRGHATGVPGDQLIIGTPLRTNAYDCRKEASERRQVHGERESFNTINTGKPHDLPNSMKSPVNGNTEDGTGAKKRKTDTDGAGSVRSSISQTAPALPTQPKFDVSNESTVADYSNEVVSQDVRSASLGLVRKGVAQNGAQYGAIPSSHSHGRGDDERPLSSGLTTELPLATAAPKERWCHHCKSRDAPSFNMIVDCSTCGRCFHQSCLTPHFKQGSPPWQCHHCAKRRRSLAAGARTLIPTITTSDSIQETHDVRSEEADNLPQTTKPDTEHWEMNRLDPSGKSRVYIEQLWSIMERPNQAPLNPWPRERELEIGTISKSRLAPVSAIAHQQKRPSDVEAPHNRGAGELPLPFLSTAGQEVRQIDAGLPEGLLEIPESSNTAPSSIPPDQRLSRRTSPGTSLPHSSPAKQAPQVNGSSSNIPLRSCTSCGKVAFELRSPVGEYICATCRSLQRAQRDDGESSVLQVPETPGAASRHREVSEEYVEAVEGPGFGNASNADHAPGPSMAKRTIYDTTGSACLREQPCNNENPSLLDRQHSPSFGSHSLGNNNLAHQRDSPSCNQENAVLNERIQHLLLRYNGTLQSIPVYDVMQPLHQRVADVPQAIFEVYQDPEGAAIFFYLYFPSRCRVVIRGLPAPSEISKGLIAKKFVAEHKCTWVALLKSAGNGSNQREPRNINIPGVPALATPPVSSLPIGGYSQEIYSSTPILGSAVQQHSAPHADLELIDRNGADPEAAGPRPLRSLASGNPSFESRLEGSGFAPTTKMSIYSPIDSNTETAPTCLPFNAAGEKSVNGYGSGGPDSGEAGKEAERLEPQGNVYLQNQSKPSFHRSAAKQTELSITRQTHSHGPHSPILPSQAGAIGRVIKPLRGVEDMGQHSEDSVKEAEELGEEAPRPKHTLATNLELPEQTEKRAPDQLSQSIGVPTQEAAPIMQRRESSSTVTATQEKRLPGDLVGSMEPLEENPPVYHYMLRAHGQQLSGAQQNPAQVESGVVQESTAPGSRRQLRRTRSPRLTEHDSPGETPQDRLSSGSQAAQPEKSVGAGPPHPSSQQDRLPSRTFQLPKITYKRLIGFALTEAEKNDQHLTAAQVRRRIVEKIPIYQQNREKLRKLGVGVSVMLCSEKCFRKYPTNRTDAQCVWGLTDKAKREEWPCEEDLIAFSRQSEEAARDAAHPAEPARPRPEERQTLRSRTVGSSQTKPPSHRRLEDTEQGVVAGQIGRSPNSTATRQGYSRRNPGSHGDESGDPAKQNKSPPEPPALDRAQQSQDREGSVTALFSPASSATPDRGIHGRESLSWTDKDNLTPGAIRQRFLKRCGEFNERSRECPRDPPQESDVMLRLPEGMQFAQVSHLFEARPDLHPEGSFFEATSRATANRSAQRGLSRSGQQASSPHDQHKDPVREVERDGTPGDGALPQRGQRAVANTPPPEPDGVREYDSFEELLNIPEDLIPIWHKGELAFRDGTLVNGVLPRRRLLFKGLAPGVRL